MGIIQTSPLKQAGLAWPRFDRKRVARLTDRGSKRVESGQVRDPVHPRTCKCSLVSGVCRMCVSTSVYRSMWFTTVWASGHSLVEAMRGQHLPLSPPDISTLCNLLSAKSTTILCLAMLYLQALSFTPRARSRLQTASHNGLLR